MYTYRCPGCGKHHTADSDFKQPFESACLRCGVLISVTQELIQQSKSPARLLRTAPAREETITKTPAGIAGLGGTASPAAAPGAEDEDYAVDADDTLEMSFSHEGEEAGPDEPKKPRSRKPKPEKSPKKKSYRSAYEDEEDFEDEAEAATAEPTSPLSPPKIETKSKTKSPRPRWQILAPIAVVVIGVCVGGGILIFGGKKATPKQQAKAAKSASKQPAKPAPKAQPKQEQKQSPTPKTPPAKSYLAISAAKLSAELAANAGIANVNYTGKVLDVCGLFSKIQTKVGLRPPAHPHLVFNVSGPGVFCDLTGSFTDTASWHRLQPDRPITVRGTYEKDGHLRECALLPYSPLGDIKYKGKLVEVTGRVAEVAPAGELYPFPYVRLEGDTNGELELRFLFRKTEADEVMKIQLGTPLTIQGTCGGWQKTGFEIVRFDNCQLVYTTAPTESEPRSKPTGILSKLFAPATQSSQVPRVEAARLQREYEEDRHPYYLPPPGQEESIDSIQTIRQLAKEWSADAKAFEKKYRHHILRVVGKVQRVGKNSLFLASGDTDLAFQLECHFPLAEFTYLRQRPEREYRIRGLFTAMSNNLTLRLDNCLLDMPHRRNLQVVTPDFLPHKPGNSFTIDVVDYDQLVNNKRTSVVRREVHTQGAGGVTEIAVSHMGKLMGKSLFDEGVQENWVGDKRGRIRIAPTTSGIYYERLKGGFIEIGTPYAIPNSDKKIDIEWAPVLKLDVQAGDKWSWVPSNGSHEYVLEKYDDYRGRPSAVVRELITLAADVLHPIEVLHIYAKGLGEVERRTWRLLDQRGSKKLLSEMRWVHSTRLESASESKNKTGAPAKK